MHAVKYKMYITKQENDKLNETDNRYRTTIK